MLKHVAIVSQSAAVPLDMLTPVAAAIQKQVTRDFGPIWNIAATVDAFSGLDQVPIGYWTIVIRDDIGSDNEGFHRKGSDGQPFALVRPSTNWTINVSHECLEMLADPWGNGRVAGASPKVAQGRVAFLVEVCDPCQNPTYAYLVNGLPLSDFFTPQYFDPVTVSAVRYSFTGALSAPREVMDGGYLTWQVPDTQHLWQLRIDDGKRRLVDLGPMPTELASLRQHSDRCSAKFRTRVFRKVRFRGGPLVSARAVPGGRLVSSRLKVGRSDLDSRLGAAAESLQRAVDALCDSSTPSMRSERR